MKEKIDEAAIKAFARDSNVFSVHIIATVATPMLLLKWAGFLGLGLWAVLAGTMLYFGFRVEKVKKQHDIHTYKEIVAFMNGEKLDSIDKAREEGKRYYQKIILCLASAVIALAVTVIIAEIFFNG